MTALVSRTTLPAGFSFDPVEHIYRVGDEVVPSVTQLINADASDPLLIDYGSVPPSVLDHAARRGRAAHELTEAFDDGSLDEERLYAESPALARYLDAWKLFLDESGFEVEHAEQRLYSRRHDYAGTVDRIGKLNGKRVVLEIKTTAVMAMATAIQCAGYLYAFNEDLPPHARAKGCVAVHLRPDGMYSLKRFDNPDEHFAMFLALLTERRWKQKWLVTPSRTTTTEETYA